MINLLPPEAKSQIAAARANRVLLSYNIILLAAIAFLLAATAFVLIYLNNSKSTAEAAIAENIARAGGYTNVETEANAFRQNLASAKQILDNDVTYSSVILQFASVLPPGVVLDTLSLDSETFGTPTTLTARVRDYSTVLTLKNSLQNSDLFSDVSIQTISTGGSSGEEGGDYPLSATYSVTIRKGAAQ